MLVSQKIWCVYILSNISRTLYVGLTDDLRRRMIQHKRGLYDGFTKKYKINRLMYYEVFHDPVRAADREEQVKKYRREKKIELFKESNPKWIDLTPQIFGYLK